MTGEKNSEEPMLRIPVKMYFKTGPDGKPEIDRERTIYGEVPVSAMVAQLRPLMPEEWKVRFL